jgi:hypothetical protein
MYANIYAANPPLLLDGHLAVDAHGTTPLEKATARGHHNVVEWIKKVRCDFRTRTCPFVSQ